LVSRPSRWSRPTIARSGSSTGITSGRILWTQFGLHPSWATGALASGLIGATLLGGIESLGFVLTSLFIVLTMDAFRAHPDAATLTLATGCAVLAWLIAPGQCCWSP
jgi:predicted branched-subunit amino acid permease